MGLAPGLGHWICDGKVQGLSTAVLSHLGQVLHFNRRLRDHSLPSQRVIGVPKARFHSLQFIQSDLCDRHNESIFFIRVGHYMLGISLSFRPIFLIQSHRQITFYNLRTLRWMYMLPRNAPLTGHMIVYSLVKLSGSVGFWVRVYKCPLLVDFTNGQTHIA